jgi:chromate transporter
LRTPVAIALAGAAVVGSLAGASEIALLLGLGFVSLVVAEVVRRGSAGGAVPGLGGLAAAMAAAVTATPLAIFLEFFKIGAVLFGSGYVMVAVLRSELVEGLGWITEAQLVDAVAVGAATPGPLFSTATFIGYLVAGPIGAVAATVGIFLPAFIAVAISIPLLDRLRRSARARAFLDGVNAVAVGLLAVVAWRLGVATFTDPVAIVIGFSALALLIRGVGSGWLIAGGAVIGLLRFATAP